MLVLITGATGKVGRALIGRLQAERPDVGIRALCHNRTLPQTDTLWVVRGSIADREICREALRDVTHVVHLATCKETPDDVMDVTVKGLFWLLEEFRASPSAQRFLLIGGDAAILPVAVRAGMGKQLLQSSLVEWIHGVVLCWWCAGISKISARMLLLAR